MGKKPRVSPVEAIKSSFPRLAEESQELSKSIAELAKSISGVDVPETPGAKTGFVLVNVPPSDGLPCRSRQD